MSSFILRNDDISKYSIKYLNNNSKEREKASIQTYRNHKPKKININKFLTRSLCFEHKKNLNIEQIRFKQILKEQNSLEEKHYLTGRSLESNKSNKKDLFFKKAIESINTKKKKFLEMKRNNTIEGLKANELLKNKIPNKYKKKNKSQIHDNQKKTVWKIFINKDKNGKIIKGKFPKENKIPKTNDINKKAKYNHDKILYGIYKENELKDFKKTYLENKYSYEFRPIINYNTKYNNISSKYNKYNKINNNNYRSYNENRENEVNKNNTAKYCSNNRKILKNMKNNDKVKISLKKRDKRLNKSEESKKWMTSLRTVNNKKNFPDSKDNTYYINVNDSLPWNENMTNNIIFQNNLSDILDIYDKFDKYK